jgi:hypothetical protein
VPDVEWLRTHSFYVTRYGWLDQRYHHCEPAPAMADEWNRDMLPLGHPLASDED